MNPDELDSMLEAPYKGDAPSEGQPPAAGDSSSAAAEPKERERSRERSRDRDRRDRDGGRRRDRSRSPDRGRRRSYSPDYRRRGRGRSPDYDRYRGRRSPDYYDDRRDRGYRRRSRSPSPRYRRRSRRSRSISRSRSRSRSPPRRDADRPRSPQLTEAERDMRTVMVMQLPRKCQPADLIKHFTKAGEVRDAKLIADRNSRRSKGIAYVEFVEPESVANALAMNGERLGPAPLIIMMTQSEKNRQAALKEKEQAAGGPCRIAVTNLAPSLTSDALRVLMTPFAEASGNTRVVECRVVTNKETGESSGSGFVEFEVSAAAQMAVEKMDGVDIFGQQIRVSLSAAPIGTAGVAMAGVAGPGGPALPPPIGVAPGMPGMVGGVMPPPPGFPPGMAGAGMVPGALPPPVMADPQGGLHPVLDKDETERSGVTLTAQSRSSLMAKLATRNGEAPVLSAPVAAPAPVVQAPPPPKQVVETKQFMLTNMFDPEKETDEGWHNDIRDEVLEECQKYGPVVHIAVDRFSKGNVYVKFVNEAGAAAARQVMHDRFFDGKRIQVEYMTENMYNARHPEALNAVNPLPPPS